MRSFIADVVLYLHFGYVAFIAGGLVAIYLGGVCGAGFIRNRIFRLLHVIAIGIVTIEAVVGVVCPLTLIEDWLRHDPDSDRTFMSRLVEDVMFYRGIPHWVFTASYAAVFLLTLAAWRRWPPRPRRVRVAGTNP